jgi:deoxyuridine 5'-triphosphate nucleotidohydrolase
MSHLCSAEDCVIPARGKYMVNTDLKVAIPSTCYGRVAPRSGLAWKHSIDTGAGVIDSDYRGPLKVILFNFSDVDFQVRARVAAHSCLQALQMPHNCCDIRTAQSSDPKSSIFMTLACTLPLGDYLFSAHITCCRECGYWEALV